MVFFVHPTVDVASVSAEQIYDIYSGRITDWAELGGAPGRIRVIRREKGDSSLKALRSSFPGFSSIKITDRSKITTTTEENLKIVATTKGSIGFGPYPEAVAAGLKSLSIDGQSPTDPTYFTFNTLALIHKEANRSGAVARFLDFLASPAARELIRSQNGAGI